MSKLNVDDFNKQYNHFTHLKQKFIDLTHSKIEEIDSDTFKEFEHLEGINLSGNHLKYVNIYI